MVDYTREWVIGIFGPILTVLPIFLIKMTKKRLEQLYNIKNVSLNIINVWMYRSIILSQII